MSARCDPFLKEDLENHPPRWKMDQNFQGAAEVLGYITAIIDVCNISQ